MLIDYTYFFGDCQLGQLSESSVQDKISLFIQKYEPEYLQGVLGYATYKNFIVGLANPTIPQMWVDLLTGKEYNDLYGKPHKWDGLLQTADGGVSIKPADPIRVVVGRGQDFDPVDQSASTLIPTTLVGKKFSFFQRGFGPFGSDEISISTDGLTLTLLNGLKFNLNDSYFYFSSDQFSIDSGTNSFKISPIAYYTYWHIQKNNASKTSGAGEGVINPQNATPITPRGKMVTAWNKMVYINRELFEFLYANKDVYTDWYAWVFQWQGLFGRTDKNSPSRFLTTTNSMF